MWTPLEHGEGLPSSDRWGPPRKKWVLGGQCDVATRGSPTWLSLSMGSRHGLKQGPRFGAERLLREEAAGLQEKPGACQAQGAVQRRWRRPG